jgi:uncharacterized protein YdhG (YjbR/CyaY superfamily)
MIGNKIMTKPQNAEQYISGYSEEVQKLLQQLRSTINKAAPKATEIISYGMPAYKMNGMLLYFAAHKNHIGLYPFRSAILKFKKELSAYKGAVGTVQFPFDKPLPLGLITKIVKFRVKENLVKKKTRQADESLSETSRTPFF